MSFQLHVFSLHVSRSHPQMNNGYLHCLLILNFPSSCKSHRIDWILCDEVIQLFSLGLPRTARMESMISCEACAMMHGTIMSLTARIAGAKCGDFCPKDGSRVFAANLQSRHHLQTQLRSAPTVRSSQPWKVVQIVAKKKK